MENFMKNKFFTKVTSLFITLSVGVTALSVGAIQVSAVTDDEKPTLVVNKGVNIAKNKTITSNEIYFDVGTTSFDNMVDGKEDTVINLFTNGSSTDIGGKHTDGSLVDADITVDLGRRYNVQRIELTVPAGSPAKQCFEINGSNSADFEEYDTFYTIGGFVNSPDENADFKDNKLTVNLDASNDYRYIRIKRNAWAWIQISELAVYADEYLYEVSRNKTVATNSDTFGAASKLVDGKNESDEDGWNSDWGSEYMWADIDLGASYPITKIEVESLFSGNGAYGDMNIRRGLAVYGSNTAPNSTTFNNAENIKAHSSGLSYFEADGYDMIASTYGYIPSFNSGTDNTDKYTLAECSAKLDKGVTEYNGIISENVSGNYRYIHIQRGLTSITGLGEVRVYTPAVVVNSARISDGKVIVSFSGDMANIDADKINIYDEAGNKLTKTNPELKGCEYTFKADGITLASKYKVVIGDGLKSSYGLDVAGKTFNIYSQDKIEFKSVMLMLGTGQTVTKFTPGTEHIISYKLLSRLTDGQILTPIIAERDASGNLVGIKVTDATTITPGEDTYSFRYTTRDTVGTTYEIYLWDMEGNIPYSKKYTK